MKKLTLRDLNPPKIILTNTYYFKPRGFAKGRRDAEEYYITEIYTWLVDVISKYNLNLKVIKKSDNYIEVKDTEGNEIAYFSYYQSARHVYKKQNFVKLLSMINKV